MKFFYFIFILLIGFCSTANAASIGVKPDKIELSGAVGKSLTEEVLIFNAGGAPGSYVLSVDDHEDLIVIEPKEFVLEAGAERLARVGVKNFFPKNISTNISIVSRPLDANGLSAGVGVKVPLVIQRYFSELQTIILSFCLALIIMILFIVIRKKTKKI